jgi:hypothetical protein
MTADERESVHRRTLADVGAETQHPPTRNGDVRNLYDARPIVPNPTPMPLDRKVSQSMESNAVEAQKWTPSVPPTEWGSSGRWFESSRPDHKSVHDTPGNVCSGPSDTAVSRLWPLPRSERRPRCWPVAIYGRRRGNDHRHGRCSRSSCTSEVHKQFARNDTTVKGCTAREVGRMGTESSQSC